MSPPPPADTRSGPFHDARVHIDKAPPSGPAKGPPTPRAQPPGEFDEDPAALRERLRVLRVELQKIQHQIAEVGGGTRTLDEVRGPLLKNLDDAQRLVDTVRDDMEWGRKLHNAWEDFRASRFFHEASQLPSERWPVELSRLDGLITEMVEVIGEQTIPSRMDDWLDRLPHGFYFSFHAAFEDEMPRKEARDALLRDLATTKRTLHYPGHKEEPERGLVDGATGLVYRRWQSRRANAGIIALILGGLALTIAGLYAVGGPVGAAIGVTVTGPALVTLYAGILLGAVVHMMVGAAKRARRDGAPPNMTPSYILVWFACRFGLWAWTWMLSLFALAASLKFFGDGGLTFWTAVLAGYSLDSVVETFGEAIDKRAFDRTEKVKEFARAEG